MFIHLNKKISVPNCSHLRCIAWSSEHDFIACGGDNGMLKVIKLDNLTTSKGDLSKNLSINQTLDSHKITVESVCWNEKFQKLTSKDANGTIIVWMFYKGMWYEEMVNNRQKSQVTGMAWTYDGAKICIVYEDGAIITGSVDGSRLWGKEIKSINLNQVEWSPDGKIILIGTKDLEIHIFDYTGNFIKKMPLAIQQQNSSGKASEFIAIKWFKNNSNFYPLIIALDNGQIFLMKNELDDDPFIVNCGIRITSVEWNYVGDMFSVTGISNSNSSNTSSSNHKNYLYIYNDQGEIQSVAKVPGTEIFDCSWERNGFKLVLAIDSHMYFANLKPRIPWNYLNSSVVFLKNDYQQKNKILVFWEFKSNKYYEKIMNQTYVQMASWNSYCVVVTKMETTKTQAKAYRLNLYNSIGTLIDYHFVTNLEVKFCCMNSSRVIVTSNDSYYIWTLKSLYNPNSFKSSLTENLYNELTQNLGTEGDHYGTNPLKQTTATLIASNNDQISSITMSEKYFIVGFDSGTINQFLLPNASCINKILIDGIPYRMALNKNSSKLALTDKSSIFYVYDFEANNEETMSDGKWIGEVKFNDVWDFKWETDNNDLIVVLEKNKLILINLGIRTFEIFEPIIFNGYLCHFQNLSMKTIKLDQLIVDMNEQERTAKLFQQRKNSNSKKDNHYNNNEMVNINNYISIEPSQYVKFIQDMIDKDLISDAINYCLQMSDMPSLWTILCRESLTKKFDIDTAHLAMIKQKDYKGLQFIKRLNKIKDENLRQAEILAYQNKWEDAEKVYLDLDRSDLALNLNKITGNFERIKQLLEKYNNLPDYEKEMEQNNLNLADYYADNYDWKNAIDYYEKISSHNLNNGRLLECYINQEKYDSIILMIDKIFDEKILIKIGRFLESMGFCKESVKAYLKANNFEQAINCCINLSEWKMATELADQYKTKNIDQLLEKYVEHLKKDKKYLEMIEVYRKANKVDEAIGVIMKLINELKRKSDKDKERILKKFYVLIGILCEESKTRNNQERQNKKTDTLNELLMQNEMFSSSLSTSKQKSTTAIKLIEDPWKGAEAYHFFLMAQRYLYKNQYNHAMNTAIHLQNYEEYLTTEQIYSLIALTSYANKCFDICSKAFIKLESLGVDQKNKWDIYISDLFNVVVDDDDDNQNQNDKFVTISDEKRNRYEKLAVEIFLKNPPSNNEQNNNMVNCKFCNESVPDYSITCRKCHAKFLPCVASGKSMIMDTSNNKKNWSCKRCGHPAIQEEITSYNNCPLCHYQI